MNISTNRSQIALSVPTWLPLRMVAELSCEKLEAVLTEIFQRQFSCKTYLMNVRSISKTDYFSLEKERVGGKTLLELYSQARWIVEEPSQKGLPLSEIIKNKGYTLGHSLKVFLGQASVCYDGTKENYILSSAQQALDLYVTKKDRSVSNYEAILKAIFEVACEGDFKKFTQKSISNSVYRGSEGGVHILGSTLIENATRAYTRFEDGFIESTESVLEYYLKYKYKKI